jgi:antitoxin MazE
MAVRAKLVQIGNARGIRIPKAFIDELQLGHTVELSMVDGSLVVRRTSTPPRRQGWDAAFKQMARSDEDALLDSETPTHFDEREWEWHEDQALRESESNRSNSIQPSEATAQVVTACHRVAQRDELPVGQGFSLR